MSIINPLSGNAFDKNRDDDSIAAESSNAFSRSRIIEESAVVFSANRNSDVVVPRQANNGWEGDNLTSDTLGFDDIFSGTPFGGESFGGVTHFKNRT